jgi:hypothetical protein
VLQARLLHMLLPLQQAAADAGQPGARQQQQQNDLGLDLPEQHSCEMTVQLEVLRRVQGFVSGLAQARIEQQQQVLPQLQQQLKQLAAALDQDKCQPDSSQDAVVGHATLSNGDGASDDAASVDSSEEADEAAAAAEVGAARQCLNYPSLAELLGFGNMQQLLLLERQREVELFAGQFETFEVTDENDLTPEQVQLLNALEAQLLQTHPQLSDDDATALLFQRFWTQQLQQSLLRQLHNFQDGRNLLLTSGHWIGLESLLRQPQRQLALWAACADAEELRQFCDPTFNHSEEYSISQGCLSNFDVRLQWELARRGWAPPGGWGAPPSSSKAELLRAANLWQQEQLPQLLHHHAGLSEAQAVDVREVCVALQRALICLERRGAALAYRQQYDVLLTMQKLRPLEVLQAACTSSTTAELFPGFWLHYLEQSLGDTDHDQLHQQCLHSGPASMFGLASLLVRAALCQLPGQQPSSAQPAAAAAAPAELQEQLRERCALLFELSKLVQKMDDAGIQQYMQLRRRGDGYFDQGPYQQFRSQQQQQCLQRLLELAVKLPPLKAANLATTLIRAGRELQLLQDRLTANLLDRALSQRIQCNAIAALCTVHGMLNLSTVLHYVQQQQHQQLQQALQQLMLQHCLTWAAGSSSSDVCAESCSKSSLFNMTQGPRGCLAATATRCGLSLPVQPHDALLVLINAANYLLDAVEPCVAGWISKVLTEGLEARKISITEADAVDQDRETLQQLLGTQMPAKEWQQYYQQSRGQLERVRGRLPALAAQLKAASQTLSEWTWSLQQLLQAADALSSLVRAVKRSLMSVVQVVQQGAAAEPQQPADEDRGTAADAAAAKQQLQQQLPLLHKRLALLQAASSALRSPALRSKSDDLGRLRDRVRGQSSHAEMVAKTAVVPPATASSNSVQVQHSVCDTLGAIRSVCNAIRDAQYEIKLEGGAAEGLGVAAAAAGLGLVAALGLWQVPPDAKGCSKNDEQALRAAADVSGSGSSSNNADKEVSWEDVFVAQTEQQARLLELHAVDLGLADVQSLIVVLRHLKVQQPELQPDQQSNGNGSSSAAGSGLPRKRVLRVMQQHCTTSQETKAAAAADSKDGTDCIGEEALLHALWGLLLATKPSVAAALHCSSLPAACRSYDAFERAVLGWPPQQEPAAADVEPPQQQGSRGDNQHPLCSCGKPGHLFGYMSVEDHQALMAERQAARPAAAAAAGAGGSDDDDDSSSDDWHDPSPGMARAVCSDPVCVARLLQQLAQQGPPVELEMDEPLTMHLMHAVQKDLMRVPEEFR